MKKTLCLMLIFILTLSGCASGAKYSAEDADLVMEAAANSSTFGTYSSERSGGTGTAEDGSTDYSAEEDAKQTEPLVFVTLSRYSDTSSHEDGTKLFTVQGYLPTFSTRSSSTDLWLAEQVSLAAGNTAEAVDRIRDWAETDYRSRAGDTAADFYTYSYYSSVSTERMDENILSVLQVDSTYSGGAHPNYAQIAYNMDLNRQAQLSLADVIREGKDRELLNRLLNELERRLSDLENFGLFADYQTTVASYFEDPDLTPYWYFSSDGLVIFFNCYEIAPYAAGIIKVEFSYDSLSDVLLPEYIPEAKAAGEGSAILLDEPGNRIVLTVPSEGDVFYIGAAGVLYDVKIHRLSSWLNDDVPIVGQMVFAANRLTAGEAVELAQSKDALAPEYLIRFRAGDGEIRTFALKTDEILEIVDEIAE